MKSKFKVADVLELEQRRLQDLVPTSWHLRTLHAIRRCRTQSMGGHIDRCNCCSKLHISYNSCRNRHCPTCQGHKREEWINARENELLEVPYFHVVFTLPSEFNEYALRDGKIIYGTLFKAAWQILQQFGNNPKHLGAKMGMISILHSWGQNMSLHPHLHCIVPGGGVTKENKWKFSKSKGKYLFNVKSMSIVFRAKYIALLRKSELKIPQSIYDKVFSKKWVVYAKQPFFKPEFACPVRNIFTDFLRGNKFRFSNGVQYLGRYTHKIAISNHRIRNIDYAKKTVTFSAKNYRKGAQKYDITLKTSDFIKRFALHILPKGFTRIRHFGILSSSWKKIKLPELQKLLNEKKTSEIIKESPTHHRRCPTCKKGKLVTVLLFDGRGPPKNWRENLKAIKSRT